jgi:cytoskeleton protein RodZ
MERFCDELRVEREQRAVSMETISAVTKVSIRHLQALESGDYNELPGGVFRKGILRSYLGVLGLEEAPWLERFEASLALSGEKTSTAAEWAQFAENVRRTRAQSRVLTGRRWLGVAGMFALLALFGWLVWTLVAHRRLEAAQPTANVGTVQTPAARSGTHGAANPR